MSPRRVRHVESLVESPGVQLVIVNLVGGLEHEFYFP